MRVPIIMPQLGESIAEATVVSVGVKAGDEVDADQEIIEVETNKALMQVTTPCGGHLVELIAAPRETYLVGAVLGYIEAAPAEIDRLGLQAGPAAPEPDEILVEGVETAGSNGHSQRHDETGATLRFAPVSDSSPEETPGLPVPAVLAGAGYHSPRVRARMAELGLNAADLAGVPGTGTNGRVTIEDLEKYVAALSAGTSQPASMMRLLVGDALRRSASRPLATVGRAVCLDPLIKHRAAQPDPKPPFVLYVMRALALALAKDPAPGSRLIGRQLLPAASIDIGCAVEVDGGLMVPVLRGLDKAPVVEFQQTFQDLVAAARRRQLPPGTSGGAIATVTNFGTFGLTWATPIPLPDESLILGLGAGRKAPSWNEELGQFVPVTEAELTLTLDHRVLDGGAAGRLMERIIRMLGEPERL
jgi:pyruvate/2-oxoglutarate dehydrogenase complex dihydrolipoamide acyltransferase (E2) component